MDEETKQFLTMLFTGLENSLRREFADLRREMHQTVQKSESRILERTAELIRNYRFSPSFSTTI